jgi:hypothetical protein
VSVAEIGIDVGLIFLSVGGAWTTLSRSGIRPPYFEEPIILLTGIHFHYAGMILPLLTGLAAKERDGFLARVAVIGVVAGVPLVALGINLSPLGFRWPEWMASWLLAFAGILSALLQIRVARKACKGWVQILLVLCGLSLFVGMLLAGLYAFGTYVGQPWLDIPAMIYSHGVINAVGFALPGLLAWNAIQARGD